MDEDWEIFENECFKYLTNKLPEKYKAELCGGLDSTQSDIAIYKNGDLLFYIEVKEKSSQAGQFVVNIENGKFVFSDRNKCKQEPCSAIVNFLNEHFDQYKDVEQSALEIKIDKDIQYQRVINLYQNEKNVHYFITQDNKKCIIFPVSELKEYFDIKCFLRRKKSGSSNIPKSISEEIESDINNFLKEKYNRKILAEYFYDGDKLKAKVRCRDNLSGTHIDNTLNTIFFSESNDGIYTLTRLSKTNNPNVIFQLTLKGNQLIENTGELSDIINTLLPEEK